MYIFRLLIRIKYAITAVVDVKPLKDARTDYLHVVMKERKLLPEAIICL